MFNGVMLTCSGKILRTQWDMLRIQKARGACAVLAFRTSSVAESAYFSGAFIHLSGKPFHYVK